MFQVMRFGTDILYYTARFCYGTFLSEATLLGKQNPAFVNQDWFTRVSPGTPPSKPSSFLILKSQFTKLSTYNLLWVLP